MRHILHCCIYYTFNVRKILSARFHNKIIGTTEEQLPYFGKILYVLVNIYSAICILVAAKEKRQKDIVLHNI